MKDRLIYYKLLFKTRTKKTWKKHLQGSVTVFLTIILLPSFLFGGYLVDASRLEAAKNIISSSGDLALNAALSEYSQDLYEFYGLLATAENPEQLQSQIQMYFDNMIESSNMLQGSDSETVELVRNLKSYLKNPTQEGFDNLIHLQSNDDLSISGVEDSKISNPDVLKNQIVEYMKYRGPISLSTGLITKLKTIGNLKSQTDATQKKMEYEDALGEVGTYAQQAYDNINTFNGTVDNLSTIEGIIKRIEDTKIKQACDDLYYQFRSDNEFIAVDDVTNKFYTSQKIKDLSKKDALKDVTDEQLYEYISKYFTQVAYYSGDQDKPTTITKEAQALSDVIDQLKKAKGSSDVEQKYKAVTQFRKNNKKGQYSKLYYYCKEYCNRLEKNKQTEENKYKKVHAFKEYLFKKDAIITIYGKGKETDYSSIINSKFTDISNDVNKEIIPKINAIKTTLGPAYNSLSELSKKMDEVAKKKKAYGTSINKMANSEYKTSMLSEYKASTYNLNTKELNKLRDLFTSFSTYINNYEKAINAGGTFYSKNLKSTITVSSLNKSISKDTSRSDIKKNYSKYKLTGLDGKCPYQITKDKNKFYKYLDSICVSNNGAESKEETKKLNNTLGSGLNQGNADSVKNGNETIEGDKSGDSQITDINSFDKNKTGSKMSTYLGSVSTFVKSFTNIQYLFSNKGENTRDSIYMAEYITEMFSYNTIEKEDKENSGGKKAVSLSNKLFNNNKFYKGEVEYILCGLNSPQANIDAVKAKLFMTRFVFNLLYAFTDSEITGEARSMATAICSGMPFLIPIVKSAIVCVFALGESTLDVMRLMDGKAVVILKNTTTFIFKPSNIGKGVAEVIKDEAVKNTNNFLDETKKLLSEKVDECGNNATSAVEAYTKEVKDNIYLKIKSIIVDAILEKCNATIANYDQYTDASIEEISKLIDDVLSNIDQTSNSIPNENIRSILKDFCGKIDRKSIANLLKNKIEELSGGKKAKEVLDELEKGITKYINNYESEIKNAVDNKFKRAVSTLTEKVNTALKSNNEKFKSKSQDLINKAFDDFNSSISTSNTDSTNKGTSSAAAGLTFTYKDYLKTFVLLSVLNNSKSSSSRDDMLKRTATLINYNLEDIDINKMFTMVKIEGTVDVKTSFINFDSNDPDLNTKEGRSKTVNYKSIRGY